MRTKPSTWLTLTLALAVVLPLASDGAGECLNSTTTLAAGVNDPVNGDEMFFKLANGAANVMLLIDNSGSMAWLPQCPYGNWGSTANTDEGIQGCRTPTITAPDSPSPATVSTPIVNGTCLPATDTANLVKSGTGVWGPLNAATHAWMEKVVPQERYADPGRGIQYAADGTTVLQDDRPPWGGPQPTITTPTTWLNYKDQATDKNCTGNNCLFDPGAYYLPNDWGITSATRRAHDTAAGFASACTLMKNDGTGKYINVTDANGVAVSLGAKCTQCMKDHGFFIFNVKYASAKATSGGVTTYTYQTSGTQLYFKGTFLNANPPKAVTSRKVIKDLLWIDDAKVSKLDQVRMGLAWFAGDDKGGLPVTDPTDATKRLGLTPTKSLSYPLLTDPNTKPYDNYKKGRLPIMKFVNANGGSFASTSTPLAHALLSVAQYYADKPVWTALSFGSAFNNSQFSDLKTTDKCSICWDCQRNSVVVVTDGSPNETETGFPASISNLGATGNAEYTNNCTVGGVFKCTDTYKNAPAMLPKVAYWMRHTALHPAGGTDSNPFVYTVGINLPAGDPSTILAAAGAMGGGFYNNTEDPDQLAAAVFKAVESASDTQSSFSAPSVSAFQTSQTSTSQSFVSRFLPSASNAWEGHVFAAKLFDEFVNGCDPTKTPADQPQVVCIPKTATTPEIKVSANFNGNKDPGTGLSICGEVFLVDQDCKAIQEGGSSGEFFQLDFSANPNNGDLTATPAKFAWDGGYKLNYTKLPDGTANPDYRTAFEPASADAWGVGTAGDGTSVWKARNIWTVVPSATGGWTRTAFTTANVATLQPFMAIEPAWCTNLLTSIGYTATSTPAMPGTAALKATACAKAIIHWVRGFDLFDQDANGCGAPGTPTVAAPTPAATCKGQERNRENLDPPPPPPAVLQPKMMFWKLGDTFHSAPVAVKPPAAKDECDLAYENQCVATLYSPEWLPMQTPTAKEKLPDGTEGDAYQNYFLTNAERKKVVLVGANDGMLHAFDAGLPDKSLPKDLFGKWQYTDGTGDELWGFVPPDMLAKLWRLVKKNGGISDHQYMVDGPTMVREVWVDENKDGTKQSGEFRVLAVVSERGGGTQWTALDVTDPEKPVVRWAFPRPGSEEARLVGQSWTDFAPRPPPIGPVKLASATDPRKWEERWVVMINGGYDPAMGLGRAVFMVDAWTGATVWRFTDEDFKKLHGYGATTSMFPVPGAVALVDIGDPKSTVRDNDGFFDTATWGDLGGNLFVARFNEPGVLDSSAGGTGRVGNWYAARTFEESRRDTDDLQYATNRSEFSYMTANTYDGVSRTLRSYVGSGNRERLMQNPNRPEMFCTQGNLFSCCQLGCTVTATTADDYGACGFQSVFSCDSSGKLSRGVMGGSPLCSASTEPVCASGKNFTSKVTVQVACPGAAVPLTMTGSISVDASGVATAFTPIGQTDLRSTGALKTQPLSRFYGIWAYGKSDKKQFSTEATAKAFEKNRFTDVKLATTTCDGPTKGTCTLVNTSGIQLTYDPATKSITKEACAVAGDTCKANVNDAGWFYEYVADERTSSGSTIGVGCAAWNSLRPNGGSGGTDMCSGSVGQPVMNGYLSDYITGIPSVACGFAEGTTVKRSTPRNTTAPPSTPMIRAAINAKGQVEYAAVTLDPGAPPGSKALGTRSEVIEPVYWLEIDRALHACRHGDKKNCK